MKISELGIAGAFQIVPDQHTDARGTFVEWYRFDRLAEATGRPLDLAQANLSVSNRGVVRGIHFSDVPPGQAKYVSCPYGAVLDVVVDIRVGSPTYGRWEAVRLDDTDRRSVYVPPGLGHGFCALTDHAAVTYLCSSTYAPQHEHGINPLDETLAINWPTDHPILSDKDAGAPSLLEARAAGLLPHYAGGGGSTTSQVPTGL